MIQIEIPGRETMEIRHVVLDYNGTVAVDGLLLEDVRQRLARLKELAPVYVLTADTYGTVRTQCEDLGIQVMTFPRSGAAAWPALATAITTSGCLTPRIWRWRYWRARACARHCCPMQTCWSALSPTDWICC